MFDKAGVWSFVYESALGLGWVKLFFQRPIKVNKNKEMMKNRMLNIVAFEIH